MELVREGSVIGWNGRGDPELWAMRMPIRGSARILGRSALGEERRKVSCVAVRLCQEARA